MRRSAPITRRSARRGRAPVTSNPVRSDGRFWPAQPRRHRVGSTGAVIRMVVPHKATGPVRVTVLHAADSAGPRSTQAQAHAAAHQADHRGVDQDTRARQLFESAAWRLECVEDLAELLADPRSADRTRASSAACSSPSSPIGRRCCGDHADRPGVEARFAEVPRSG